MMPPVARLIQHLMGLKEMNTQQRNGSLQGLAMVIAQRPTAIKQLTAEQGKPPPRSELARQFKLLCYGSKLRYGPPSTREMELLAAELVPRAVEEFLMKYEKMAT
jgi:hypothetical protein